MHLSKDKFEEIMAGSHSLEFVDLTLQQQKEESPQVFNGSGFFYYKDGNPYLKFLHNELNSQHKAFPTYSNLDVGTLIGEEYFFELTATDLDGNTWHAINIDPFPGIKASQQGIRIDCKLHELKMINTNDHSQFSTTFFVPQKLRIPCNKFQELGEYGSRRTRSSFDLNGIKVTILLEDNYTKIELISETEFSLDDASTILESFSVASGLLLTPALIIFQGSKSKEFVFRKIDSRYNLQLMEFIPRSHPYHLKEWITFSEAYIKTFQNDKTFYYYWVKIFNAHQADLENETLSLTVSIEGLVNKFFSQLKKVDTEFRDLCNECLPEINKLNINDRVKKSIVALLQRSGSASVKGALFSLVEAGIIPKELVDDWAKARNKSAHAEQFHKDSWQENIRKYTSCITLFYFLLSYHINYTGLFCHYHLPNAPLGSLKLNVDEVDK
ncbi:hypothetical protein ACMSZQ_002312 [Cronobacter dublinensis]